MVKKSLVGRPPVIDKDVLNKLETSYSMGCTDSEACLFANISKQTLYNYQDKHPEFVERKEMLKKKLVLKARSVIADALNKKDEKTAQWYLERKCKDEFSTKQEIGGNVSVQKVFITKEDEKNALEHINGILKDDR